MSETKKFTDAELTKITQLRDSNAQKINEFGQVELEILLTNQRKETLERTKEALQILLYKNKNVLLLRN